MADLKRIVPDVELAMGPLLKVGGDTLFSLITFRDAAAQLRTVWPPPYFVVGMATKYY